MMWLYVACGGAIGATCRYVLSLMLPTAVGSFPWATWWANIIGCGLIGLFAAASEKYPSLQMEWRLFLVVGILGGFTTFSSFGLETFHLLKQHLFSLAMIYVFSSILMGMILLMLSYFTLKYILA